MSRVTGPILLDLVVDIGPELIAGPWNRKWQVPANDQLSHVV